MSSVDTRRRPYVFQTLAAAFGVVTFGGVAGVVWWWVVGYDEAERLGMATPSTDAAMVASSWTVVVGFIGLAVTFGLAALGRRMHY